MCINVRTGNIFCAGCLVVGILPLVIAFCALALIFLHWLQLRKLRAHIKLPEVNLLNSSVHSQIWIFRVATK
jgi:hypothetical protein